VGGGGHEHALARHLARSPRLDRLVAARGNPGIGAHATCVPVADAAIGDLAVLIAREQVDRVVAGSEVPGMHVSKDIGEKASGRR